MIDEVFPIRRPGGPTAIRTALRHLRRSITLEILCVDFPAASPLRHESQLCPTRREHRRTPLSGTAV